MLGVRVRVRVRVRVVVKHQCNTHGNGLSTLGSNLSFRGHGQPFNGRLLLPCEKASGHHQLCNLLLKWILLLDLM